MCLAVRHSPHGHVQWVSTVVHHQMPPCYCHGMQTTDSNKFCDCSLTARAAIMATHAWLQLGKVLSHGYLSMQLFNVMSCYGYGCHEIPTPKDTYCNTAECAGFASAEKSGTVGGGWGHLHDLHMLAVVAVCRNALVGTGLSNSCLVCTNGLGKHGSKGIFGSEWMFANFVNERVWFIAASALGLRFAVRAQTERPYKVRSTEMNENYTVKNGVQ